MGPSRTGAPIIATMLERWLSTRACKLHLALLVIVPGCLIAGWWQLHQALGGNGLSWAYTFEWPCFAILAAVAWWHLIHEDEASRDLRLRPGGAVGEGSLAAEAAFDTAPAADLPERVAVAARREYELHLRKLAEESSASHRPARRLS